MQKTLCAAVVALLAAVTGCSSIESGDLETSGITASIEVRARADGSATDVFASLSAGALTSVDLDGEDKLVASSGDVSVELSEDNVLGLVNYTGTLTGVSAAGTEVNVALERSADKTPAPTSVVRLPEPITMTAPEASATFSRADDDITVTLESGDSQDAVRLNWSGDCIKSSGLDIPAGQTSVTINKGTIEKAEQVDANDPDSKPVPDTCTVTLSAERRITGTLDAAWGGGRITSVSSSSRDVTSNL